jgi:hypothetical protein
MSFVELDRTFFSWSEDRAPGDWFLLQRLSGSQNWSELLKLQRVIVLAEAGSGKSDELKAQAKSQQKAGRFAFYVTVQDVARPGLPAALNSRDRTLFAAWKNSEDQAWFLVDSVDELKLDGMRLETALKELADAIEGVAFRANIILSGRITDWEFRADLARFEEFFPVPLMRETETPRAPREELVRVLNHERQRERAERKEKPSVFLMTPLDSERIKRFAAAKGVERVDEFVSAIDDANLGNLAARPVDLIWLIEYWQRNHRFGTLVEMLETSISERLRETNPQHGRKDELPTDKAEAALERIGAALDFGRLEEIAVPDSALELRSPTGREADIGAILPEWGEGQRRQLLGRAVFDAATYGRVRLHNDAQGVMRSYLAARWLRQRLRGNCPRSAVYELLFAETYGHKLVRPSMHQTAAWLSIWDADIAREVLERHPRLLLDTGDPSSLSPLTRQQVLSGVVEDLIATGSRFSGYSRDGLRRIAQPDMAGVVRRLWDQHKQHEEVRHLLLIVIELGPLKKCVDIACEGAWQEFPDRHTKIYAGRAVLATADAALLDRYAAMLKANVKDLPGVLIWDALRELFPGRVSVDELLSIFQSLSDTQRDASYGMQINGPHLVEKITRRQDLERLLGGLLALIGERPDPSNYQQTPIERAYEPTLDAACKRLLAIVGREEAPEIALDAALRLGAGRRYQRDKGFQPVIDALQASPERRRALLWRAAQKLDGHPFVQKRSVSSLLHIEVLAWPSGLRAEDLPWVLADFPTRPTEAMQLLATDAAMSIWRDNGKSAADLERIREVVKSSPAATRFIEAWLSPPPQSEEMRRMMEEHERITREQAEQRAVRDQSWVNFIEEMKADPKQLLNLPPPTAEGVDARLFGLWQLINSETSHKNRYAIDDIAFLEPILGAELVGTLTTALIAFWKYRKPTLDSERDPGKRNVVYSVDCMGLIGVSLQAKGDPQWANRLTADQAVLAAQYATLEINGFPSWLSSLAQTWPNQVGEVFLREVQAQLAETAASDYHGLLDDLAQAPPEIPAVIIPRLVEELRSRPGLSGRQLSLLLDIVTRGLHDGANAAFTALALERFEAAGSAEVQALYLGAAFSTAPVAATDALMAKLDRIEPAAQTELGQLLLPRIFGNHLFRHDKKTPDLPFEVLERLVHIAYQTVKPADDNVHEHGAAYSSDGRDYAETARSAAFNQLCNTPGYATFAALERLATTPGFPIDPAHLRSLALNRALQDSERAEWPLGEAYALEQEFDLAPRTPADLRSLAMARIAEIEHDLLNADYSQGAFFKSLRPEREVQKWVASELRNRRGRAYTLEREPHVVDEREPDIRLQAIASDAKLPVEIKVAESWTRKELEDALTGQLCGKYMRERGDTHGVLLLVHQEAPAKGWSDGSGNYLNFKELVAHLQRLADDIARSHQGAPQPEIATIDVSVVRAVEPKDQ